jgi:CDP-diacylglycerol--serine O-phosphatidyltransferase
VSACVIRLARFNVEQAGRAKVAFHGLPSPSAGMTLATFYPFSQTSFFRTYLADWNWPTLMTTLMVVLGFLMMSHVLYPVVPRVGMRTMRGIMNGVFLLTMIVLAATIPSLYFFPALLGYVVYGLLKATLLGFLDRLPERDPMLDEEEGDDAGAELREIDYTEMTPVRPFGRRRRGRRRKPERPGAEASKIRPLSSGEDTR